MSTTRRLSAAVCALLATGAVSTAVASDAVAGASSTLAAAPSIKVSPITQNAAAGQTVRWTGSTTGGTAPARVTVSFGNGSASVPAGNFRASRVFHPCEARSVTYTQIWTVTDAAGRKASTKTTVKVSWTGPICS